MFVKICGITTEPAALAAVEAGADAIGFVFADSPREISPRAARALAREVPATMLRVAVFRHPERDRVARVVDELAPDWVQTDAEDFAALELPDGIGHLPVYRTGHAPPAEGAPARLLYEGSVSGSGERADWDEARRLAAGAELVLAGGLDADNVAAAIRSVRPWGVDVSSGVELKRGVKDPGSIHRFVARVRALEQEL